MLQRLTSYTRFAIYLRSFDLPTNNKHTTTNDTIAKQEVTLLILKALFQTSMNLCTDEDTPSLLEDSSSCKRVHNISMTEDFPDIRQIVANFIKALAGGRNDADAWWYVAIEDDDMRKGLSTLSGSIFMFEKNDCVDLLLRCGILRKAKDRVQFNKNGAEDFITQYKLQEIMEVTRIQVPQDNNKRRHYIRLGQSRHLANGAMWKFTPAHQVTDISLRPPSTRMPKLSNDML